MSAEEQEPGGASPGGDPLIGATLKGTYRVDRRVGEGGMGCVYEAEHVRLHRRVAIKVLLAQFSGHPEVLARFRREAEIIGSLGHPHIVQVIDVDETEAGEQFLVMEFLEGETLADRLEREPRQQIETALRIASEVASALAGTHDKGIVHRDLKPENIFLVDVAGEKDFVKVLDFGISKVRRGGPKLTAQNVVIGTPAYMAPEQARADQDVDHRADQFALAAITFEMLAGQAPYPGDDPMEVMREVVFGNPRQLSEVAPWISNELAGVVMRALSRKPDDRFPGVTAFARALEEAQRANVAPASGVQTANSEKATLPRPELLDGAATVPRFNSRDASMTKPRPAATPKSAPSRPASRSPSRSPHPEIAESVRTPPPPPESHRIERVEPSRRLGVSETVKPESSVLRPKSVERVERVERVNPDNRVDRVESARPGGVQRPVSAPPGAIDRVSANPPGGSERPPRSKESSDGEGNLERAERHLQAARTAFQDGRHDLAVEHAERLMELGVFGRDAAVFAVLRGAMPLIDRVFEARVGSADRQLRVSKTGRERNQVNLSSRAVAMLDCVDEHRTVGRVLDRCGIPRRDAVRMLAGLLRRGLLE